MSNSLGHSLHPRAICPPLATENQRRAHLGYAEWQKCKSILSRRFLGNRIGVEKARPSKRNHMAGCMAPRAALATDQSSELAGKFNLDPNSELQVSVQAPSAGSATTIDFRITNGHDDLVLHWGGIREMKKDWALTFRRPDGTKVYKNKALRTPFVKSGPDSLLSLEIDDPEIQAIEFLILDEAQNRWFKNNGENFQVKLPEKIYKMPSLSVVENTILPLPEDIVQINAYLRWERNGRQSYTPEQEKLEYEAARAELLEEISKGTSIEELWARLRKVPDDAKKADSKNDVAVESEIPPELVQAQAYVRWERAGEPNYSPDKQLMEFEEARKELQRELDEGASLADLSEKLLKGSKQSKISAQLKTKKYFTAERIHRKKRNIVQLLNKYSRESSEERVSSVPKTLTTMEVLLDLLVEKDGNQLLNKKLFKIGDKELLVLVTNPHGKIKVYLATDEKEPLILHWALSRSPGEWLLPTSSALPPHSSVIEKACETPFVEASLKDISYQALEIEIDGNYNGIPFVMRSGENWINNCGSDFYVEFDSGLKKRSKDAGDGKGTSKALLDKIAELEMEAQKSLMHRFNIAADLIEQFSDSGTLCFSGILVWMRFMATRQLVWNKNYNVKPREISKAQDRLTNLLQIMYQNRPENREMVRMIMSTVGRGGEGDVGQRIRDEILVIQRNNDCKGGMMEEWHQKLHNNTSPDDVVICQALIDFILNDFDINVYWDTLNKNGVTKERLLSYDRAIHLEPCFRSNQKEGLLRDLGNYMRTLKAVHSGADLESAIATCMGYKTEGEGFMVGVQINPIRGLPSEFSDLLKFILDHIEDNVVEPLLEALVEARAELRPLLLNSHDRLKDLIFLDIALDSTVRTAVEWGYEELNNATPEKIIYFISLVLENIALSSDDNEDILYCMKGWNHSLEMCSQKDDHWALYAKSFIDRTRLALSSKAELYNQLLQPSAEYLGGLLGVDKWAVNIFTEEIIRGGSAASLSALLNRLDPILRKEAHLGSWQVISPVEVSGYVVAVDELLNVQNNTYDQPTILVAKSVKGEEEIPDGTVAVLTPDMPDVLSHVSVRARNSKVCFATCFDPKILSELREKEGKLFRLKPISSDIIYSELKESELSASSSSNLDDNQSSPSPTLVRKKFHGKYAISSEEFTTEMVGAKSRNISYLKGKVPPWVGIPTSVALPFGVFERVLSDEINQEVTGNLQMLKKNLQGGDFEVLTEIRRTVLQLAAPSQLVQELKEKMMSSGMPWPGDEGKQRWEQAWMAIKKVWASKWNERAYFSTRKVKLDHDHLCMAVLVQEIISADYAFVIHTTNPSTGDSSQIYAEVVKGLGETLVGAYPGRALSFVCQKNDLNSPKLLGYPSKPVGLFIKKSIIFRSDSNGEDLEGYAGAGLYDSVPMDEEEKVILDYTTDPLVVDPSFRNAVLCSIAKTGNAIEELYGYPQDIEGVIRDGKIFVVQTRPQM